MKLRPIKFFGLALLLVGTLATVLILCSCEAETPTMCPTSGLGVLEGYLLIAGEGTSGRILAEALEGANPGTVTHSTESDSTGWYRLELPTGLYQLKVVIHSGGTSSSELHDTIRVLPRVFRFDILRGRAEVRIGMPPDLEGQFFHLRLRIDNHDSHFEAGQVEEGSLVFEFPGVSPGSYAMELSGGDMVNPYYLPASFDPDDGDHLQVDTETPAAYQVDFTSSYATISGTVTGSWQEIGPGWTMAVKTIAPDSMVTGKISCHPDGTFTCGFLVPEMVRLRSDFFYVDQWFGGDTFETATVFDLQPGDRITGVDLVESGIQVWLDGPGNLAFHRPDITLRDEAGREFHPDSNGNPFSICNLKPGRYYLKVAGYCNDESWAPQWLGGAGDSASAAPIDLAAGELRKFTMDLVPGGRIEGTLRRANGTLPRPVEFGLFDAAGDELCASYAQWRYYDEGAYRFRGLVDGDYYMAALTNFGEKWWYPGTREFSEAVPVTIENLATVAGVDWNLP